MKPITIERWYPFGIGVAVLAGGYLYARFGAGFNAPSENLLSALVSLGGIVAGFIATVETLLLAMNGETKAWLKSTGYIDDLVNYLNSALWVALGVCVTALCGFIQPMCHWPLYTACLFAMVALALACLHRVTNISLALLKKNS